MPKLPSIKPKSVIAKFKKLGFTTDHQTGSHVVMYNTITKKRAVIPFHPKDLPRGTLSHILKEANIPVEEFLKV